MNKSFSYHFYAKIQLPIFLQIKWKWSVIWRELIKFIFIAAAIGCSRDGNNFTDVPPQKYFPREQLSPDTSKNKNRSGGIERSDNLERSTTGSTFADFGEILTKSGPVHSGIEPPEKVRPRDTVAPTGAAPRAPIYVYVPNEGRGWRAGDIAPPRSGEDIRIQK
jgi:hypothetical protein